MVITNHPNIDKFISYYDCLFIKYQRKFDIKDKKTKKYLYYFDVDYFDSDLTIKLPDNTGKFGKTDKTLYSRLNGYNIDINMRNIECIKCNYPSKVEKLIKAYLNIKTSLKPIVGLEYFTDCKNYIKLLFIIFYFIPDDIILEYYEYYDDRETEKYKLFFNKLEFMCFKIIEGIIEKLDDSFNFYIKLLLLKNIIL